MNTHELYSMALRFEKKMVDDTTRRTFNNARAQLTIAIEQLAAVTKFSGESPLKRFNLGSMKLLSKLDSYQSAESVPNDLWDKVMNAAQNDLYSLKSQLELVDSYLKQAKRLVQKAKSGLPQPEVNLEEPLPEMTGEKE